MLLSGLGSVRIVKKCDLGLENAALGLRPRAAFSRPRSHFFAVQISQPANNIYLFFELEKISQLELFAASQPASKDGWMDGWMDGLA